LTTLTTPTTAEPLPLTASAMDVYGPGHVLVARFPHDGFSLVPFPEHVFDAGSANTLSVTAGLPLVCHADSVRDAAVHLLRRAGYTTPHALLTYQDRDAYGALLRRLAAQGRRLAVQYAHPSGVIPDVAYWIPRDLLVLLNDKASLPLLVNEAFRPERYDAWPGRPCVVKASGERPSGGGFGVAVCADRAAFDAALLRFGPHAVIVEEHLDLTAQLSVQFAVHRDGRVACLGVTEQLFTAEGTYAGNWLDPAVHVDAATLDEAHRVMRSAASRGYYGFAGVDVACTRDGRSLLLDLNFRVTGATPASVVRAELARTTPVMLTRGARYDGPLDELVRILTEELDRGRLHPLMAAQLSDQHPARCLLIVRGQSRADVRETLDGLAARGVH